MLILYAFIKLKFCINPMRLEIRREWKDGYLISEKTGVNFDAYS